MHYIPGLTHHWKIVLLGPLPSFYPPSIPISGNHQFVFWIHESVLCLFVLDATYKWEHTVFVFVCLIQPASWCFEISFIYSEVCQFLHPSSWIVRCVKAISLHFLIFSHFGYLLSWVPSSTGCFFPRKYEIMVILLMKIICFSNITFVLCFSVSISFCIHYMILFQCWLWWNLLKDILNN